MNQISNFISKIYGILLIAGGIMGFVKAHSKMSLLTGAISGILVFISCSIGSKRPKEGYLYVSTVSLILAVFFALKFKATHAFMPAGLMLILSTTTFVIVGLSFLQAKK
ncbi:MAG: TMEM14 family protein [Candidatus Melainabacteria bacterium]|nr:TMEM14 family protein [Candidatus Melainabacteria bacterium]